MRLLHVQTNCPEKVDEVFQAAIKKNLTISKHMRPSYLEYTVLTKGIIFYLKKKQFLLYIY